MVPTVPRVLGRVKTLPYGDFYVFSHGWPICHAELVEAILWVILLTVGLLYKFGVTQIANTHSPLCHAELVEASYGSCS